MRNVIRGLLGWIFCIDFNTACQQNLVYFVANVSDVPPILVKGTSIVTNCFIDKSINFKSAFDKPLIHIFAFEIHNSQDIEILKTNRLNEFVHQLRLQC